MLRLCFMMVERYFFIRMADQGDALTWNKDLKEYSSGDFSIAIVQVNSNLEDQGPVLSSHFGTYIGVYDGHGGLEESRLINNHLFPHMESFAFAYMEDERDAEDAIRGLNNTEFGQQRRRLSMEWARGDRGVRHREEGVMQPANTKPTKTIFVINFDPLITRVRDLERHFEPYGKLLHVRIRMNFTFIQYETQKEATKALECTHVSKLFDRVISVEYDIHDDDDRNGQRESLGRRGGYGRRVSPAYDRSVSPIYGRQARRLSPDYGRHARRLSPDYGRAPSPFYERYRGPVNDRIHSPIFDRYRSRSPVKRPRTGRIY